MSRGFLETSGYAALMAVAMAVPAYAQDIKTMIEETEAAFPEIREMANRYNFTFSETKDPVFVLTQNGVVGKTLINYDMNEERIITNCDATIYTGQPVGYTINGEKRRISERTPAVVKSTIIHEVLEVDEIYKQLKKGYHNKANSHRTALRRQLDYDVGLTLKEYIEVYADYVETGGKEFPTNISVDEKDVVNAKKVRWTGFPGFECNDGRYVLRIPYLKNGSRKTAVIEF